MSRTSFSMAPVPILYSGVGKISTLPDVIRQFGKHALLITGKASFRTSVYYQKVLADCSTKGISVSELSVVTEPSPAVVDQAVNEHHAYMPDVVVGIGGGSVLDAAKAISAMLPLNENVKPYLEGVGNNLNHPGKKIPLIAVPTTSGTGSETTRNAVISEVGDQGYKRSLRHMNFVSNVTILDPNLMISCPPTITATSGMDAFTQLLESYLSTAATLLTDRLAEEGLRLVANNMRQAFDDGENLEARVGMALAAYLSGITLTNAGLGLVHGLAGTIGGYKAIPHGAVCSALMHAANKVTLRQLRRNAAWSSAIQRYAFVGRMFTNTSNKSDEYYSDLLIDTIGKWNAEMKVPGLGVTKEDLIKFSKHGDNKNNPVALSQEEIFEVLESSN